MLRKSATSTAHASVENMQLDMHALPKQWLNKQRQDQYDQIPHLVLINSKGLHFSECRQNHKCFKFGSRDLNSSERSSLKSSNIVFLQPDNNRTLYKKNPRKIITRLL